MNNAEISKLIRILDSEGVMTPLTDFKLAFELLARNQSIIKDYPSCDEALKILSNVIESVEELNHLRS